MINNLMLLAYHYKEVRLNNNDLVFDTQDFKIRLIDFEK